MERLRDKNDLIATPTLNRVIERTDIFNSQLCKPIPVLKKSVQQLRIFRHRQKFVWFMSAWVAQCKTTFSENQVKPFEITCRRHHIPMVIIHAFTETIQCKIVF